MEVLILGMHRSGTSLVSGIINKLGVFGGEEEILNRSGEWNPKGYWEFRKLTQANNRILAALDRRWDRVIGLDEALLEQYREQVSNVCDELVPTLDAFKKHGDWAVKDPRMCLLLPAWRAHLSNPLSIVVIRNPVEVAISLKKRNQMPLIVGAALWEVHMKLALKYTQNMPRIFVDYNTLLENPAHEIKKLQKTLADIGVKVLRDTGKALELVDGSLYRSRRSEISADDLLNRNQIGFYESLCNGSRTDEGVSPGGLEVLGLYEKAYTETRGWKKKWRRIIGRV